MSVGELSEGKAEKEAGRKVRKLTLVTVPKTFLQDDFSFYNP